MLRRLLLLCLCFLRPALSQSLLSFPAVELDANNRCLNEATLQPCRLAAQSVQCPQCDRPPLTSGVCEYPWKRRLSAQWQQLQLQLPSCQSCSSGQTASANQLFCLGCPTQLSQQCTDFPSLQQRCPSGQVLVDSTATGQPLAQSVCTPCPNNAYPNQDYTQCIPCSDPVHMRAQLAQNSWVCVCDTNSGLSAVPQNGSCVSTAVFNEINGNYPPSQIGVVKYRDLIGTTGQLVGPFTVKSEVFTAMFVKQVAFCQYGNIPINCQVLANMCVLQNYDASTAECDAYIVAARAHGSVGSVYPDWPENMPWIYYNILSSVDPTVLMQTSLNVATTSSPLVFVLAVYDFQGNFLGLQKLTTQLQLCPMAEQIALSFLTVGQSLVNACSLNLALWLSKPGQTVQTLFYDMYLLDAANQLIPVPVRMLNYRSNGQLVNVKSDMTDFTGAKFTRRFFMVDLVSSQPAAGGAPSIMRIAQTVSLKIPVQKTTVMMPVLEITYTERSISSLSSLDTSIVSTVPVSFTTTYQSSESSIIVSLQSLFIVLVVFAGLTAIYQCHHWNRRTESATESPSFYVMTWWVIIFARLTSFLLFFAMSAVCIYWFAIFKYQGSITSILPTDSTSLLLFTSCLWVLFGCSLATVLFGILNKCSVDIFFIDWEKTRGRVVHAFNEDPVGTVEKLVPVSIWRTLFIANEWCQLQIYRRVRIDVTLIFVLLVMVYGNLRELSYPTTNKKITPTGSPSPILLFALNVMFWVTAYVAQWIWSEYIYGRFYSSRLLQFIDLLSLSNISLFLLDESFHGLYIHGRSPHPHADTDMADLVSCLKKEERDMVSKRGLEGDQQIYELWLTKPIRSTFDKVASLFQSGPNGPNALGATLGNTMTANQLKQNIAKTVGGSMNNLHRITDVGAARSYQTMTRYLSNFIDNNVKDSHYKIRERSSFEKYAGASPLLTEGIILFGMDPSHVWSYSMAGLEWKQLIFYFILYTIIDIYSGGPILAAFVVFIIDTFFVFVWQHLSTKNVAEKAFVDGRFLV